MSDLETRCRAIIVERLGIPAEKITDRANLIDDLGADSLDIIEIVMDFEEAFDVEISDAQIEQAMTFRAIVELVSALTGEKVS